MNGWLIKINGWQEPEPVRLFAAAEPDPQLALVAIQKLTDARAEAARRDRRAAFITNQSPAWP